MLQDVARQPGRERKASGRCKVLRDVTVCRMMSRDVGKGLDPKRDELYHGRRVMPQETRYAAGDETYRRRRVGSGRRSKTEWGKGVPLTESACKLVSSSESDWKMWRTKKY